MQGEVTKSGNDDNADLLEGDLDENLGMDDNDLGMNLDDFGDDFNILEFADALDGNDTNKTNILDDLEAEDDKPDEKDKDKPPPYPGPPPPYPGQQKVRLSMRLVE